MLTKGEGGRVELRRAFFQRLSSIEVSVAKVKCKCGHTILHLLLLVSVKPSPSVLPKELDLVPDIS